MTINNIELDFDLWNVNKMAKYQKANELVIKNTLVKCRSIGKSMKYQCDSIDKFMTTLFGKEKTRELIPDKDDYKVAVDVFVEISADAVRQINEIKAHKGVK